MANKKKGQAVPRGLYLRENGMYYSRIAGPDGKLIRRALSMDKQTAILMLNEMRKNFELQRMGIMPQGAKKQIKTFAELRDLYLKHLRARGLSECSEISFEQAFKCVVFRNHFVYLQDMTLARIEAWVRQSLAEGLAGQTANFYVGYIKRALQWALNNGFVNHNILANWMAVRKTEPQFRRDFRPEEIQKLFEAEVDPDWRLLWMIYFHTGLRLSAGTNVCWEWIDWEARILRLPLEENKSRRVHKIPLSPTLFDALAARRLLVGEATGRILPPVRRGGVRDRLVRLCKRNGIDVKGICVHSIRHTVATLIYDNTGKNLKAVQEILGHANPTTTMRYLHVTEEDKRNAIASLDFGQIQKDDPEDGAEGALIV